MKKLLVVDDEESVRSALVESLSAGFTVRTAAGGREACALLDREAVDLVITDLRMPEMDGLELITHLRRDHPGLPVIVVSGHANAEEEAIKVGSVDCFAKPFSTEALRRRVEEILAESVKGRVENINLASFLQLLAVEHKSCTLRVESQGRKGQLFCRGGHLVDATTGDLQGQDAALEIVTWENTDIEIFGFSRRRETLQMPLPQLLLEAMRLKDESERNGGAEEAGWEPEPAASLKTGPIRLAPNRPAPFDLAAALSGAAEIAGRVAVLVARTADGALLGTVGEFDSSKLAEMAGTGASLLRKERRVLADLALEDSVEEMLITGGGRYAILRPLAGAGDAFLLVLLDREPANIALARLRLAKLAEELAQSLARGLEH
jgi:CheY-like chemotaxis protein/predicted regulator of Ras-like GTPase activity (Roadblock/LC7/MglB family)